jgi:hypothetical protein
MRKRRTFWATGIVEVEQVPTTSTTTREIMSTAPFAAGVADVRTGKPARFDALSSSDWGYERGRMWALVVPMSVPLRVGRRLNPEAMRLFDLAWLRGDIR